MHTGRERSLGKVLEALLSRALENWCDKALSLQCCVLGVPWDYGVQRLVTQCFFGHTLLPVLLVCPIRSWQRRAVQPEGLFSSLQELKEPLADTKAQLDATAFDIQFLISEHAQDLTPQQSRQLLRLLNELQKAFRDLSERVATQVEVLQVCLQQAEQTDQVKVVAQLLPGCSLLTQTLFQPQECALRHLVSGISRACHSRFMTSHCTS